MSTENKSGRIGMLLFLATEAMFFAGLVSAYWVLRSGMSVWPPLGQPRLPVFITGINTLILLSGSYTVTRAEWGFGKSESFRPIFWLSLTALTGAVFLAIQGYEWIRLIRFGLQAAENIYAGTFYVLIGAHGLHVLAALIFLLVILILSSRGRYTAESHVGVTLCRMYWIFVVAVWPVLYVLVYLL